MKQGYIYCLINPAFEGLLKIGFTTKNPMQRAKELSASTGVPYPYTVAYSTVVEDVEMIEKRVHVALNKYKVNNSREFFNITLTDAIKIIEREARKTRAASPSKLPWAELFASFPDDGSPRELTAEESAKCEQLANNLKYNSRLD